MGNNTVVMLPLPNTTDYLNTNNENTFEEFFNLIFLNHLEVYFSSRYIVCINLLLSTQWTECQMRLGWNAGPQDLVDSGLPAGNSAASASQKWAVFQNHTIIITIGTQHVMNDDKQEVDVNPKSSRQTAQQQW